MAILDDHGLEVIRKAGVLVDTGPETKIRTSTGGLLQGLEYDYLARTEPTTTKDRFTFKSGGSGGTTVAVIDVTYEDITKAEITIVERTT